MKYFPQQTRFPIIISSFIISCFAFSALFLLLLDRKVRLVLALTFSSGRPIITLHCLLRLAVLLGGTGQAEAGEATLGCGLICSFDCRDGV